MVVDLLKQFDEAMFNVYRRAKLEANYTATIFLQMLTDRGELATAKYLIYASKQGRLDLTVEALVLNDARWHTLFTADEIAKAARRLRQYGWNGNAPS